MTLDLAALAARFADRPDTLVVLDEPEIRWSGYASLIPQLVPIDSIEPHPRNPRRGNLDVIGRSLTDFGQTKAIVAQASTRWIVAGNHTRRAALEKLGWTHIAGIVGEMDDETALAYLLADNRSSDLGEYDTTGLIAVLEEVAEQGRLASTGYSGDDIDDLIADADRLAREAAERNPREDRSPGDPEADPGGDRLREVVLLYDEERHRDIAKWLGILRREWKIESQSEAVAEALRRAAANP